MSDSVKMSNAMNRLTSIFDDGVFTEIDAFAKDFNGDIQVVAGYGLVNGAPVYAFSQNICVDSGAIGTSQCKKILKVYDLARKTGCPVVAIYDSNGVKLNEGFDAINEYGNLIKAASSLSGVVPQISVIAGACLGGCAIMANLADIVIGVKDSEMYVSTPNEITADVNYENGCIDILADDFQQAALNVKSLIGLLPSNNLSSSPYFDFNTSQSVCSYYNDVIANIKSVADENSFVEIKGGYAKSVTTGFGSIAGYVVGFIGFDENELCHKCAYKAESMIRMCDAYNIPLITFADSKGISRDDVNNSLIAITKLTSTYATATCPKISLVTKQSIGSSYIVLAGKGSNADLTFAWENAVISPLEVNSAVAFLYNDRLAQGEDRASIETEYKNTVASPFAAAACGAVDDIFAPEQTREKLISALEMLMSKRENTIARKHSVK